MENQLKLEKLTKDISYEILEKRIKKGRVHTHPFSKNDYFISKGSNTKDM